MESKPEEKIVPSKEEEEKVTTLEKHQNISDRYSFFVFPFLITVTRIRQKRKKKKMMNQVIKIPAHI
jgi:hypothetical protein